MIKNKQRIVGRKNGDCMRACLTSLLDLPNDSKVISIGGANEDFWQKCRSFLRPLGLELIYNRKAFWRAGYWMASVPSKNYKGVTHSIVMHGHRVCHDPSTKKRYKGGTDLLGKGLVQSGFHFEVIDASKLTKLIKLQRKLLTKE